MNLPARRFDHQTGRGTGIVLSILLNSMLCGTSVGLASAQDASRQIPFSSWLDAQTADFFAFFARSGPQVDPPVIGNWASFEGFGAQALGHSYGLSVRGSVKMRTLPDGTAEITANITFSNVITVGWGPGVTGKIFGYEPDELFDTGRTPALSSGHVELTYITPHPESPVLDLHAALGGTGLQRVTFSANGSGPLRAASGFPEGTPGRCEVAQVGLLAVGGGAKVDAFPVERVEIRPIGAR